MSDLFALSALENRDSAEYQGPGVTSDEITGGLFHGIPTGIGMGIGRAGAHAARALEILGDIPVQVAGDLAYGDPDRWTDSYFRKFDPSIGKAIDYFTPTPGQVGTVGNILGGVSETVALLAAGGGNPIPLLATAGLSGAADLSDQGVSPDIAAAGGTLESAANAFGFKLPILGKSLVSRLLTGAAGNLAVGRGSALAEKLLLEHTGNEKQAEQINPWNVRDALVDTLTGLAFGGLHHLTERPARASETDAALTALNAKHYQSDIMPGEPHDLESFVASQEAMHQATNQTIRGEPVTAPASMDRATFEPRAETAAVELPPEFKALDANRAESAAIDEKVRAALPAEPAVKQQDIPRETAPPAPAEPAAPKESAATAPAPDTYAVQSARQAALTSELPFHTGEFSREGTPITMSAKEVLAKGDAEIAEATKQAKAIAAVASCFLANGVS